MAGPNAPRFRHLCLMAPTLEPGLSALQRLFGLAIAHRDPIVARWGIENAVLPVGHHFIELCAPIRADAPARRYLSRRPGGGGYIVVTDCADLPRRRAHVDRLGLRVVTDLELPGFRTLQLHPRDTGGCMLEFNTTEGGGATDGAYLPAGPAWQDAVRTERIGAIAAVELRARAPERMAAHWAQICEAPVSRDAAGTPQLDLGGTWLRFAVCGDDDAEGVAGVDLVANDAAAVLASARELGLPVDAAAGSLQWLSIAFRLVGAPPTALR